MFAQGKDFHGYIDIDNICRRRNLLVTIIRFPDKSLDIPIKISNTVDVPFRLTVKPTMTLQFIRTVLGKTENELPDDSISELHFSIRPYATQNIRFPCLGKFLKNGDHVVLKLHFIKLDLDILRILIWCKTEILSLLTRQLFGQQITKSDKILKLFSSSKNKNVILR